VTTSELERDVRRAVILGAYEREWGIPSQRVISHRGSDVVEIYTFPGSSGQHVNRFATVGVSSIRRESGTLAAWELYIVVPKDNGGASVEEVTNLLLDVMAYSLRQDVRFAAGETIPESPLLPRSWKPRALLLDEPRGESETLANFHVGLQHVKLVWLVPIYSEERALIGQRGIAAFDDADQHSEWSLADPARPSLVRM
jgi:hypothetical protein